MRSLIIGEGEIGEALCKLIENFHITYKRDIKETEVLKNIEVLHICFPDSDKFVEQVQAYILYYKPVFTFIHSSVRPGTTMRCGEDVLYSPVRGRHSKDLTEEMKIFTKWIGVRKYGRETENYWDEKGSHISRYFTKIGITTCITQDVETLEICKLLSNIHMGLEIAWRQEIRNIFGSDKDFEFIYEKWEQSYLKGYLINGDHHLIRPQMKPDPIGGHCILDCIDIMKKEYQSPFFDLILETNKKVLDNVKVKS